MCTKRTVVVLYNFQNATTKSLHLFDLFQCINNLASAIENPKIIVYNLPKKCFKLLYNHVKNNIFTSVQVILNLQNDPKHVNKQHVLQ